MHGALLSGDPQDQLAITCNLVVDNKRLADESSKLETRDFFVVSSPPGSGSNLGHMVKDCPWACAIAPYNFLFVS